MVIAESVIPGAKSAHVWTEHEFQCFGGIGNRPLQKVLDKRSSYLELIIGDDLLHLFQILIAEHKGDFISIVIKGDDLEDNYVEISGQFEIVSLTTKKMPLAFFHANDVTITEN